MHTDTSPVQPARSAPVMVPMEGRYVRLEPLELRHAVDLYRASSDEGAVQRYRWLLEYAPTSLADMEAWVEHMLRRDDVMMFAIVNRASGQCEGRQGFLRIFPEHASIEVGGVYWGPEMARTRKATEAFYLFARHVFDDLGYRRFEWKCNNLNEASKAAARRLGFQYEGLFRQDRITKGESRDTAWFSLLSQEWPAIRQRMEAWLHPDNFDAAGQQVNRLQILP